MVGPPSLKSGGGGPPAPCSYATVLQSSEIIVKQQNDKKEEDKHVRDALGVNGYPNWIIEKTAEEKQVT